MWADYLELAWHNIKSRRLRSWLTILGIVIGVMAVVALIAIGQGMKQSVEREFEAIGYDTILVFPGGGFNTGGPGGGQGQGGGRGFGPPQSAALNLEPLRQSPQIEKIGFTRSETAMLTIANLLLYEKTKYEAVFSLEGKTAGINFAGDLYFTRTSFRPMLFTAKISFEPDLSREFALSWGLAVEPTNGLQEFIVKLEWWFYAY